MRKSVHALQLTILCIATLVVLSGCSQPVKKLFPTKIEANIVTSDDVNPDQSGRPSPIVLRIYELKSIIAFNAVDDFFRLWDDEAAILGGDLISRDEFELMPGEVREFSRKPSEDARFLGIIAAYRGIDQSNWRASGELEVNKKNKLTFEVDRQSVNIVRR